MGVIIWNGVGSDTFDLIVEKSPNQDGAARRYDAYSVPGRNGSVLIDQAAYENIEQSYEIAFVGGYAAAARAVRHWLVAPAGYCRLQDDYDTGVFRQAYFVGPLNIENTVGQLGRATITFSCRPERWLESGEEAVEFTADGTIENETENAAKPLIRVYNSGASEKTDTITVNGTEVQLTVAAGGYIDLDCERMDASSEGVNMNGAVALDAWPQLDAGENAIDIGTFSKVEITPRWWIY